MLRWIVPVLIVAVPASAQVYSLSPAEKSAAIEAASQRPDADDPALLPALPQDRRLHGEFGAMIGTGGARGIYGTVGVALGDTGHATFGVSHIRLPSLYGDFGHHRTVAGTRFGAELQAR